MKMIHVDNAVPISVVTVCYVLVWCCKPRPFPLSEVFTVSLSAVDVVAVSAFSPPSLASSSCFISISRLVTHFLVSDCTELTKCV